MKININVIILIIFFLGFILGYGIGTTATYITTLEHAEVTVDLNESKIIPIMLNWMEEHGYWDEIMENAKNG